MRKAKTYALAATGLLLLALILETGVDSVIAQPPDGSGRPLQDVRVVNTPAEPVPTTLTGTPTVELAPGTSVGVSGTVGLVPGTTVGINPANNSVRVGNTDANPVPVRDVGVAEPFQVETFFSIDEGSTGRTLALAVVPAGKRLVIEHVTVLSEAPHGQAMGARVTTRAGGATVAHHLALTPQGPLFGVPAFVASQPMRVYADPGTTVLGILFRSDPSFRADGLVTLSGHLVDLP